MVTTSALVVMSILGRLKTQPSRIQPAQLRTVRQLQSRNQRITGTALQAIRHKLWLNDPRCAKCGRTVRYPDGFELDHVVPLWQGGPDDDSNRQILCVHAGVTSGS